MTTIRRFAFLLIPTLLVAVPAGAFGQKLTGKKLLGLLGKDEASVTNALGKPTRHFTNPNQPGFVRDSWGKAPNYTCEFAWSKSKEMPWAIFQGASTWQAALAKYGLKPDGVTLKDKGDGDYGLDGLKGLPKGWACDWSHDHTLYLYRSK